MLAIIGCDSSANADSRISHGLETKPSFATFDAGVVLTDRAGYLCVPLERFGLERPDEVLSVTSTCDCICPKFVEYASTENSNAWAVLLEFKRQEPSRFTLVLRVELANQNNLIHLVLAVAFPLERPLHLSMCLARTMRSIQAMEIQARLC